MANKKTKGRPPKFVLDENGKEVYGLSYNKSTRMYYATFSDPRVYFSAGGKTEDRRKNAIDKYKEWTEAQQLSPEQQKEKEELDRIYDKARQLLSTDEYIQEEIKEKAKELLEEAEQDKTWKGYGRFTRLVSNKAETLIKSGRFDDYLLSMLGELHKNPVTAERVFGELRGVLSKSGNYHVKKPLMELLYDELEKDPIRTAKAVGIPQLALIDLNEEDAGSSWSYSMTWDFAWKIFDVYRPGRFNSERYRIIRQKLSDRIGNEYLSNVYDNSILEFLAGENTPDGLLKEMSALELLQFIEEVFTCIKKAGFPQADAILSVIKSLYSKLSK